MISSNKELEVKFFISNLQRLESQLQILGITLVRPRTYENNLRFDTPDHDLARNHQILRLRLDDAARCTFKGPSENLEGVSSRQELEFIVSDFEIARALFLALGFQMIMMYEKYRTIYKLNNTLITLDEMPYGNFIEIEGPDSDSIKTSSQCMQLDWDARITDNYFVLFERVKQSLGMSIRDLSFENFNDLCVDPETLGVIPGDKIE